MSRRDAELYHFGIKGMHWGERRFQNEDGSLTSAGRLRYLGDRVRNAARDTASRIRSNKTLRRYAEGAKDYAKGLAGMALLGPMAYARLAKIGVQKLGEKTKDLRARIDTKTQRARAVRQTKQRLKYGYKPTLTWDAAAERGGIIERGKTMLKTMASHMSTDMAQLGPNIKSAANSIARTGHRIVTQLMPHLANEVRRRSAINTVNRHMREGYQPQLIWDS